MNDLMNNIHLIVIILILMIWASSRILVCLIVTSTKCSFHRNMLKDKDITCISNIHMVACIADMLPI